MTDPYQHNCPHEDSGWCLDCVAAVVRERDELRAQSVGWSRLRDEASDQIIKSKQERIDAAERVIAHLENVLATARADLEAERAAHEATRRERDESWRVERYTGAMAAARAVTLGKIVGTIQNGDVDVDDSHAGSVLMAVKALRADLEAERAHADALAVGAKALEQECICENVPDDEDHSTKCVAFRKALATHAARRGGR